MPERTILSGFALCGMLANPASNGVPNEELARRAVEMADDVSAQLRIIYDSDGPEAMAQLVEVYGD